MKEGEKRKEIWLQEELMDVLKAKAESKGWSLKQYLELICTTQALKIINESNKKNK